MKPVTWDTLDWGALDRLRETFLAAKPGAGVYWNSINDLANYDFTYAQRIRWKWQAVLRELSQRGWNPPGGTLTDWGCGSGIASRTMLEQFGAASFTTLQLSDQSGHAVQFAMQSAQSQFPHLKIESGAGKERAGTLVVSHVLNELDEVGGRALREVINRADAVLWVEPGTYADSRSLIMMREALRAEFEIVAPCTHQAPCGLLTKENERHWCHHFAEPPAGIMADSDWVRFAQRAGLDLRSLPYSFLVLERRGLRAPSIATSCAGCSRIIGRPRVYKGFSKVFACSDEGVHELELQKREAPEVHRAFKDETHGTIWRWTVEGGRIHKPAPALPNANSAE